MGYTVAMPTAKWTRLSRHPLLQTPYYTISHDRYVRPDGDHADYHYLDTPGSVIIVPVCADGRLVMIRQHRYLMGRVSLEFPAGGMEPGEDAQTSARRELQEEAGLEAQILLEVGTFAPYNGVSNELCRVFVASDLRQVAAAPEPTEELEVVRLAARRFQELVRSAPSQPLATASGG